jgi:hypothetical protein
MALSGLNCPNCKAGLRDSTTKCDHCHIPIGKREWKRALDNEVLEVTKGISLTRLIQLRLWLIYKSRIYQLKAFGKRVKAFIRQRIINAT